jgi:hypothetical protein
LTPDGGSGGNLFTERIQRLRSAVLISIPQANNGQNSRTIRGDAAYVERNYKYWIAIPLKSMRLESYQYHGSVYGVIP